MGQKELEQALKVMGLEHLKDKPEEMEWEVGRWCRKWLREHPPKEEGEAARVNEGEKAPTTHPEAEPGATQGGLTRSANLSNGEEPNG